MGLSVVPLVYMMVHRSSGLGGMGGEGFSDPSLAKASKLNTLMPKASVSCKGSRKHRGVGVVHLEEFEVKSVHESNAGALEMLAVSVQNTLKVATLVSDT